MRRIALSVVVCTTLACSEDQNKSVDDASAAPQDASADTWPPDSSDASVIADSAARDSSVRDASGLESGPSDASDASDSVDSSAKESGVQESGTPESGTPESGTPESGTPESGTGDASTTVETGWTNFVASADTTKIYVSNSTGNDAYNGLSETTAVKTLARGISLLRDGYPDWLLLNRGDSWSESFGMWTKSGQSATAPMLISNYGTSPDRPLLLTGVLDGLDTNPVSVSHLAIVGVRFSANSYTGTEGSVGIKWYGGGDDILIEDVFVAGYGANIVLQPVTGRTLSNVRVRRSVIVDSYISSGYSQGLFVSRVNTLLVEENIFNRNGVTGATSEHNHNMYLQVDNTNITTRANISSEAGATGMQQRPGGLCEENLFLENPIGVIFGHAALMWPTQKASGTFRNNVIMGTRDINSTLPRGIGAQFQNLSGVEIAGNVVAHHTTGTANTKAYLLDTNFENVTFHNNLVYDWYRTPDNAGVALEFDTATTMTGVTVRSNDFQETVHGMLVHHTLPLPLGVFTYQSNRYFSGDVSTAWFRIDPTAYSLSGWTTQTGETGGLSQQVSYPNPGRTISTYHASLGKTGTLAAFLTEVRLQRKGNWRTVYTAQSVNSYIRAGFGL